MPFTTKLRHILLAGKTALSRITFRVAKSLNLIKKVIIIPYKGFGNQQGIYFIGRVIKDKGIIPAGEEDSMWQNFRFMYKRFSSFEITGVAVKATFYGTEKIIITDDEGYFEFHLQPKETIPAGESWHETTLELLTQVVPNQGKVTAKGRIFIPESHVEYGIISDIDDTILSTDAARWWKMLKVTFVNNARTRMPFAGVSAFYRALQQGATGEGMNPFFYVSSSPWNLYDLLVEFLDLNKIPKGPLMLRDLGISRDYLVAGDHATHKLKQIEHIFSIYPELTFILIGDSGQQDPEIYLQVIKEFQDRVKTIYIRNVSNMARQQQIATIAGEIKALGVDLLLVKDTVEAAVHAAKHKLIIFEEIASIEVEKELDNIKDTA